MKGFGYDIVIIYIIDSYFDYLYKGCIIFN